jgi:PST family polysaccharide transporter
MSGDQRLGARTLRGMFWAYFSYVGGRLLVLLSTALLARLLTPEEFGVVGFALVFMALLETVKDLGLSQALVASAPDQVEKRASTVFWTSVALGAVLSIVVAALAPLGADFFDAPELTAILPVLGLNFLLNALGGTHYALAQKRLDFKTRTIAEFADVMLRGVLGVVLALAGAGVWALVIGYVAGTAALVATLWVLVPWRPTLRIDRAELPALLRFGGALTGVDITAAIVSNVDYVFIGKVLGASSLGLYTLGFRLPELVVINMSVVAGAVLFPAFANVVRETLPHVFLVSLRYVLLVSAPLAAGLAILAEPLVLAAFGDQWRGAVGAMQVLSIYGFAATVGIPAGTAYKSVGRADILLKLAIPRTVLLVGLVALFVDRGITAVAACQAAVAGLFAVIGLLVASRLLTVRLRAMLGAVWPPLIATTAMAAVTYGVDAAVPGVWPSLLAAGLAGAAVYAGVVWLVARDAVEDLLRKLRPVPPPPMPDIAVAGKGDAAV